jgi:chaperonin GroEL (HSP60 family)
MIEALAYACCSQAIKKSGANVILLQVCPSHNSTPTFSIQPAFFSLPTVFSQKSILRDAVSDLALHYLAKLKILLVKDIERDEIEFTCKTLQACTLNLNLQTQKYVLFLPLVTRLQCSPIASVDGLLTAKLGLADLVEEISTADGETS